MSFRACRHCGRVADELAVDGVGQTSFQAAHRFSVALALGSFPQIVGSTWSVLPDLGEGHDVKAEVELAIACAGQTVADHIAGGHLDGSGAGVAGEGSGRAESSDGPDPPEDVAGGQRADTMQLSQGGTGSGDSALNVSGSLADPAIKVAAPR